MKKIAVIYHRADFDGLFSREIARRHLGDAAEYIGWDYGDPRPLISGEVEKLYMIDISVEGMMDDPRLVWIDHHKSAIEKFPRSIHGYRIDGVAACRLAWQWFNNQESPENPYCAAVCWHLPEKSAFVNREVHEPCAVRLAGEYDIWDKRDPRAELFQHGLRSVEELNWERLLGFGVLSVDYVVDLLEGGEVLQRARRRENESIIKAQGFTIVWEGLTFLACNAARYNSHLFTAGLTMVHDACLGFRWDGGKRKWSVSLYGAPHRPDLDLSAIAIRHGGGGHKQACGFECATLPFELNIKATQPGGQTHE